MALNFSVEGWSRNPKSLPGLTTHHGRDGLRAALQGADFVVTLLPRTPETENTLNAETLGWAKPGAVVLNPGRGALIDDDALLAALATGQIGHATLDVFRVEPLPKDHAFWAHPNITVTPHIAADTRPHTSAAVIAENIRRGEAGEPFVNLVDRQRGY
jgi:glyoxylate/hydroxypyruvate reductase A